MWFGLNELAQAVHADAMERGFWSLDNDDPSRALLLIISEAVEAMEELRAGHGVNDARWQYISTPGCYCPEVTMRDGKTWIFDNTSAQREITHEDYVAWGWQCKPVGVPSEMADIIIRALDTCAQWGIDIEEAVRIKREYNATRGYMNGGKKF